MSSAAETNMMRSETNIGFSGSADSQVSQGVQKAESLESLRRQELKKHGSL